MDNVTAQTCLSDLSRCLVRQKFAKPIILLDGYDAPLHEAWDKNYWSELINFMRGLFISTFKSNQYLGRALITGITKVAQESIFSDANNIKVVSITSDFYTDSFGFTEQEVFSAMDEYGLNDKSGVKEWYDGFIFGNKKGIYNPCSIIGYLTNKKFAPYWMNTSSNRLVGKLLAMSPVTVKNEATILLQGNTIITKLDENIIFSELYTANGAIWSLLMATGYVKPKIVYSSDQMYELALTNYEVKLVLHKLISNWLPVCQKNNFINALLANKINVMNETLSNIAKDTFRFFDTNNEPEKFYYGFVLGLIADINFYYQIICDIESGYGRYDIILLPKITGNHGIVIEFKTLNRSEEKSLEEGCVNALKRIMEKGYTSYLEKHDVEFDNIYIYGIAFSSKKLLIRGGSIRNVYYNIDAWSQNYTNYKYTEK